MKTVILTINSQGKKIAQNLKPGLADTRIIHLNKNHNIKTVVKECFGSYPAIIFIAATGIVVRLIAPYIKNKLSDPAVVVIDSAGRFSISLLSGHEGGANALAYRIASALDASPVITTGTESAKKIIMGIGCRRNLSALEIKRVILQTAKKHRILINKIRLAATIELKKNDLGLNQACNELNLPLVFKNKTELNRVKGIPASSVVKKNIGINGVCEPCALLAGRRTELIVPKQISKGVTIAFAKEA